MRRFKISKTISKEQRGKELVSLLFHRYAGLTFENKDYEYAHALVLMPCAEFIRTADLVGLGSEIDVGHGWTISLDYTLVRADPYLFRMFWTISISGAVHELKEFSVCDGAIQWETVDGIRRHTMPRDEPESGISEILEDAMKKKR